MSTSAVSATTVAVAGSQNRTASSATASTAAVMTRLRSDSLTASRTFVPSLLRRAAEAPFARREKGERRLELGQIEVRP